LTDRSRLRQFIFGYFNDDELEDLTFDYFPDVQKQFTTGMNKSQKVRDLVDFADRYGRLDHLLAAVEKARPESFLKYFNIESESPALPPVHQRNENKIFISYANIDQEFAYRLAMDLREAGFEIWIAPASIYPGEKWVDAINRGLLECGIFLLVLTPEAVNSKWVYDETSVAIALENKGMVRFLTLSVKPADSPPLWMIRQHIPFDEDYYGGLKSLLATLRPQVNEAAIPTTLPPNNTREPGPPVHQNVTRLVVKWPDGHQKIIPIDRTLLRVGRAPHSDVVLDDPVVSNSHLLLETKIHEGKMQIRVTDLGTTNGTFVNDQHLSPNVPYIITSDDTLYLGNPSGKALAIVVQIPPEMREAENPPILASAIPLASESVSQPSLSAIDDEKPAGIVLDRGDSRTKRPAWVVFIASLVLLSIAVYVFLTFFNGQRTVDGPSDNTGLGNEGVAAFTMTEAVATQLPTLTLTAIPTPSVSPTVELLAVPTRDLPPTPLPPTTQATLAPTLTPTTLPPSPTLAPSIPNTITLGVDNPLDFQIFGIWDRGDQENGTLTQSDETPYRGEYSARLDYQFQTANSDFVVFMQRHAIIGEPNALRVWVYGDGEGHFLNAWIIDKEGQIWQMPFGQVSHTGWQQMTAVVDESQPWPWSHISGPDNGVVDYPIRFYGLVLDDVSSDYIGEGTIYLDELTVATVGGLESAASATQAPSAAATVPPESIGSIFFTGGNKIYTTDPAWNAAIELGTSENDTCFLNSKTTDGTIYPMAPAPFCSIGGGTAVCASPNRQYEVLVGSSDVGRSVLVRPAGAEEGTFITEGALSLSEGILWSPTNQSFLFVRGNAIIQAYPDGSSRTISESGYSPQFSPDGQWITFISGTGGPRDIYVYREGSGAKNISNLGLPDAKCPRWAGGS
jgi:hypothetical protein